MADDERTSKQTAGISQNSYVSIGIVVLLLAGVTTFVSWRTNVQRDIEGFRESHAATKATLASINAAIRRVDGAVLRVDQNAALLRSIASDIDDLKNRRIVGNTFAGWHRYSMGRWADELKRRNPSIDVPDPSKTPWFDKTQGVVINP